MPMPAASESDLSRVLACGVVPVIRANSIEILPDLARALLAGNVAVIEVTMTTPKAIPGIERLADSLGDTMVIGVGTVLDAATASEAIRAGARFVVSPHFDPEIVAATKRMGRVSVPGAFTTTEILRATASGADLVKVFPSTALGPGYFRDLMAPLPHLRLIPTGGVDLKNVADWFRAGAACVGVGSALFTKDAMAKRDWPAITAGAKAFADAVRAARNGS